MAQHELCVDLGSNESSKVEGIYICLKSGDINNNSMNILNLHMKVLNNDHSLPTYYNSLHRGIYWR